MYNDIDLPNNMFDSTKVGRVLIAIMKIKEDPEMVLSIMSEMIPVACGVNIPTGIMEYVAISDHFDELQTREHVPIYTTQINSEGCVKFIRTTFKRDVLDSVKDEIMRNIIENGVNVEDFKQYVLKYTKATEKDFAQYDETFLETLRIYIDRREQ